MSLWNPRSIAAKLTRMNLLVSGTALLLAYIAFLGYDFYTLRHDLIGSLSTEADIVGANCVTALMFDDRQSAESTLEALRQSPQVEWGMIVQPDGRLFAQYVRDPSIKPVLTAGLAPGAANAHWPRGSDILLGKRIVFQGSSVGAVYLFAETGQLTRGAVQFGLLSREFSPSASASRSSPPRPRAICSPSH
jgi:hypothetical protein